MSGLSRASVAAQWRHFRVLLAGGLVAVSPIWKAAFLPKIGQAVEFVQVLVLFSVGGIQDTHRPTCLDILVAWPANF